MKLILQENNRYIIRFDPREEAVEELKDFCRRAGIESGAFFGIGAAQYLLLSCFNPKKKLYEDYEISDDVEIASLLGNISSKDEELFLHIHGTFTYPDGKMRGGHVKKLVVSATCEIYLDSFQKGIKRVYNEEVGLHLLEP